MYIITLPGYPPAIFFCPSQPTNPKEPTDYNQFADVGGYEPTVSILSSKVPPLGGQGAGGVEFRIKDNGSAYLDSYRDSLAYDNVVKGHGGALESTVGVGTTFDQFKNQRPLFSKLQQRGAKNLPLNKNNPP